MLSFGFWLAGWLGWGLWIAALRGGNSFVAHLLLAFVSPSTYLLKMATSLSIYPSELVGGLSRVCFTRGYVQDNLMHMLQIDCI